MATKKVSITDSGFSPTSVTAAKGDSVVFKNDSTAPKKVTFDVASLVGSSDLAAGAEWTYKFDSSGTFGLHVDDCPEHKVSVVVS
jgi:plastocyanin